MHNHQSLHHRSLQSKEQRLLYKIPSTPEEFQGLSAEDKDEVTAALNEQRGFHSRNTSSSVTAVQGESSRRLQQYTSRAEGEMYE